MLRSAPMTVLSSPVSKPLWPRCAVAPVLGTAFALRPETPSPTIAIIVKAGTPFRVIGYPRKRPLCGGKPIGDDRQLT